MTSELDDIIPPTRFESAGVWGQPQPRSGERIQNVLSEVEWTQAVGNQMEECASPAGAKENFRMKIPECNCDVAFEEQPFGPASQGEEDGPECR